MAVYQLKGQEYNSCSVHKAGCLDIVNNSVINIHIQVVWGGCMDVCAPRDFCEGLRTYTNEASSWGLSGIQELF